MKIEIEVHFSREDACRALQSMFLGEIDAGCEGDWEIKPGPYPSIGEAFIATFVPKEEKGPLPPNSSAQPEVPNAE